MPKLTASIAAILIGSASLVLANHGPGTSGGGGASTISGETLQAGKFNLGLKFDFTDYQNISNARAMRIVQRAGGDHAHYDVLDHALVATLDLQYGLTEDLQLGAAIGYYWGDNFREAHLHEDGDAEIHGTDVDGLTDLWINARYRLMRGAPGHLSILAGFKVPVGNDNQRLTGERLEPSSQPGTGSWDFQLGLAYSRFLTSHLTLDASILYTLRTEHDDFKVGDRFDAGLALNYRLTDSIKTFPQVSVFGELLAVWVQRDQESGHGSPNSGNVTLYLQPGVRVRITPGLAVTGAVAVPVLQNNYGDQPDTTFKATLGLEWSF